MSFFSKLFGISSSKKQPQKKQTGTNVIADLPGSGTFSLPIVGESSYQDNLEAICGKRTKKGEDKIVKAVLILENTNPYDKNAVRIDIEGKPVGHLSREHATQYRKHLKKAGHPNITASCKAKIRGGWDRGDGDRGHYGVWLDLPMEDE